MTIKGTMVILLVLCSSNASSQTRREVEAKYGSGEKVYSVSEHIWMTPQYNAANEVCLIRLYPKRISTTTNYFSNTLHTDELRTVLNELAPLGTRGARAYGSLPMSDLGGGVVITHYPYEHVEFTFITSYSFDARAWQEALRKAEPINLDGAEPTSKQTAVAKPVLDELPLEGVAEPEIVEIRWKNRKCASH